MMRYGIPKYRLPRDVLEAQISRVVDMVVTLELVLALGQDAYLAVLDGVPGVTFSGGTVDVGPDLMTGHPGIFAGAIAMVPEQP